MKRSSLLIRCRDLWLKIPEKTWRLYFLDLSILLFSVYMGYALRLTLYIEHAYRDDLLISATLFSAITIIFFHVGKLYSIYWNQASIEEYARLARWYAFSCLTFMLVERFIRGLVVPRSSLAIMLLLGLFLITGSRFSWRLFRASLNRVSKGKKTLIIGAGEAGSYLARDLKRNSSNLIPVGFVDDDPVKLGKNIAGLKVLGSTSDLSSIVRGKKVESALIAMPTASSGKIRSLFGILSDLGIEVRVLPSLRDLADGKVSVNKLRNVELQDLLCRDPQKLDLEGIRSIIREKRVLVTGAGGSIGSEICLQLLKYEPSRLILLGHGEHSIYKLLQNFEDRGSSVEFLPVIGDVADEMAMKEVFSAYRPEVIFHAAAHKHVPLMESNPREACRVNGMGTYIISKLAGQHGCERMVMISTDKAVNPTSVMGATKRLAEMVVEKKSQQYPGTAYMTVRFGNVLGSRGSVIPRFEKQIHKGGPVTVTHREMKRYFMLIPEAVSLVLQAAAIGKGGEVFVLDMGEPVLILEMAEMLIRLHGYEPYKDIDIEFSGSRPGEKLFEELFYDPEHVERTSHTKIFISKPGEKLPHGLDDEVLSLAGLDDSQCLVKLHDLVREFTNPMDRK